MARTVYLLSNLGSPDSTDTKDVRRYLNEFLMDERVIDIPKLKRTILVKGLIVPFRAPRTAAKYKTIWTNEGSPLIHCSEELTKAVQNKTGIPTYLSMRYGSPSASTTLQRIIQEHPDMEQLVLLPLYPHYAMSSFETGVKKIQDEFAALQVSATLKVIKPYYANEQYINALSATLKEALKKEHDHVLFSYHGIPERHVLKTDPTKSHCLSTPDCCEKASKAHEFCYAHQVKRTTHLVAAACGIPQERYSISFQSRLGRDPWLMPNTDNVLKELPAKGVKRLIILCPSFVSDCLETLEEIKIEGRETFTEAGGTELLYVPCLNLNDDWIDTVCELLRTEATAVMATTP